MQKDAHRIFQWIMVSSRPLLVEELAEVFAIDFDQEMSGIPKFEPRWRDPNAETAVLSACSTLVAIVDISDWRGRRKIVQFSHFSVKEYLASNRIANSERVSRFHIHPKPAHTLLAKSCLSVLFHLDYSIDTAKIKSFPLAEYAAEHWVVHARFEDVSSYIQDGMDLLFDEDKPHFTIWVWVFDIDEYSSCGPTTHPKKPDAVPLYYAALCGFRGLVERLLTAHPQHLNAEGGFYGAPLNVALDEGHLDIALFLADRGADGQNRGKMDRTGLYIASSRGYADVVRSLIDRGADLNAICQDFNEYGGEVKWTPLHVAISEERRDIAVLLLERGADTETRSHQDETALHVAISYGTPPIARTLLEHGADPNAPDNLGTTALHVASLARRRSSVVTFVEVLLEYGANVDARDKNGRTPLHEAAYHLNLEGVVVLLNRGADPRAQTNEGETPIQLANAPYWPGWTLEKRRDQARITRLLSERTSERA